MKKVLNQIKFMEKNRPDLFHQFLFGITMATLSFLQIVAVLLACVLEIIAIITTAVSISPPLSFLPPLLQRGGV